MSIPFWLDQYSGTRVIVLGASGFLGRWVARYLHKRNAELSLIIRDSNFSKPVFEEYAVAGQIYELDLRDKNKLKEIFAKVRPAITFNLAGYGVDRTERDEQTAYELNRDLLSTLVEAVQESSDPNWQGQHLIHAGSVAEYGQIEGELNEKTPARPDTLYGKSKLAGTSLLSKLSQEHNLRTLTARLFALYGRGEHNGRLLPSLIKTAETGQPLCLTTGTQKKDFTYVGDVAEALLRLGLTKVSNPGEVVHVATGQLTSVKEFVSIAARLMRIPPEHLQFGTQKPRQEDVQHPTPNIDRLESLVSWIPRTSIEDGIARTMSFSGGSGPLRGSQSVAKEWGGYHAHNSR